MARIDDLPADQRAALQLLLKQGRSYDEIAQLLRIDESAVRERARAALDNLGPDSVEGLSLEQQDEVADYLLGQQSASRRAATREFLETSAAGRAWARVVAGELRPIAGDDLPEVPSEAAEVDEAFDALQARTTHREKTERSSRIGGALLLAGLAIGLVFIVLLATGTIGGDDDEGGSGSDSARTETTSTTSTQAEPQIEAQVNLTSPERVRGRLAVAQIARQGDQRAVALVAQGLPAATEKRFYAIWLYSSQTKAKRLGFPNPQPTSNGRMETGFPLPEDADQYTDLVVTRETQDAPKQPGPIVLRGKLQQQQSGG